MKVIADPEVQAWLKKRNGGRMSGHRRYSRNITESPERAPSRAMLRAIGFEDGDFLKSQVGIASTWSMVTPCNMHIDTRAFDAEMGVNEAGGKGVVFNTITISDGISMGTEGTLMCRRRPSWRTL